MAGGNRDVSEMRAYKVSWNQVTLSAGLSACKTEIWQVALLLFSQMVSGRISPKAISFSAAISACEASNWQMVLGFLPQMSIAQVPTDVVSCGLQSVPAEAATGRRPWDCSACCCPKGSRTRSALMLP